MKTIVIVLVLVGTIVYCDPQPEEKYSSQYDDIDIDQILHSDRLLKNYMNCLLDKGRCTPDGMELKKNLPEAMENDCAKCSEFQKKTGQKVLKYVVENKREIYDQIEAKYDPEGKYRKKYQKDLESAGIKI